MDVLVVDDGSTDGTAAVAREHGAGCSPSARTAACAPGIAAGLRLGRSSTATRTAAASTPTASTRRRSCAACSSSCAPDACRRRRRLALRQRAGLRAVPLRAGGRSAGSAPACCAARCASRSAARSTTRRAGSTRRRRRLCPLLAEPYESGAPEVEALLRLHEEGLRVEEVPVDMRERAERRVEAPAARRRSCSSITVIATLLGAQRFCGPPAWRRLVAVLGYSRRRGEGIHPVCAARLAAAERPRTAPTRSCSAAGRGRSGRASEASLMQAAWRGPDVPLLDDGDARTTVGNARAVAAAAKAIEATRSSSSRPRGTGGAPGCSYGPRSARREAGARLTRPPPRRCTCVGREPAPALLRFAVAVRPERRGTCPSPPRRSG